MKKLLTTAALCCLALAAQAQPFFQQTTYRGAFGTGAGADWTANWSNFDPINTVYPGDPGYTGSVGLTEVRIPAGTAFTGVVNWTANNRYVLEGPTFVNDGGVLNIAAGTVIRGALTGAGDPAYLLVARGGRINAVGTATQPIVFTSAAGPGVRESGDWGGLLLCGRAPVNINRPDLGDVGERNFEALETDPRSRYGGTNPMDNSGRLSYVRVEFAGDARITNQELNGLMLAGVGRGTQVDHIQVSYANDDSFEWFGGTVDGRYLIAFAGSDDDFDVDEGYTGRNQFLLAVRHPSYYDVAGAGNNSNLFEIDNNTTSGGIGTSSRTQYSPGPVTSAVFTNVTAIGPLRGGLDPATINTRWASGINMRTNPAVGIFNSVVIGTQDAILTANTPTLTVPATITTGPSILTKIACDSMVLRHNYIAMDNANPAALAATGGFAGTVSCANPAITSPADLINFFTNAANQNVVVKTDLSVASPLGIVRPFYTGTVSGVNFGAANVGSVSFASFNPTLQVGSPLLSGADFSHPRLANSLAVSDLVISSPQNAAGSFNNVTVQGAGVATLTGNLNVLGTLVIRAGTTVNMGTFSVTGPGNILVEAGATIAIGAAGGTGSGIDGAFRNSGTRNINAGVNLIFNGTAAQVTGNGVSSARNVTINNAAGVTISQALSVTGVLALQSGVLTTGGNLVLAGTSSLQGAIDDFTTGYTGSVSGPVTVRLLLGDGFRQVSSPVAGATLASLNNAGVTCARIREFEEATNSWIPVDLACGSQPMDNATSFLPLINTGLTNINITGTVRTGAQTASFSRTTALPGQTTGFNGLGNPYPSPIQWSAMAAIAGNTANSNLTAYIYNPLSNNYGIVTSAGVASGGANNLIAVGQGFIIRRSTVGGPSTLTFNNSVRRAISTRTFVREGALNEQIRLKVASADGSDELLIAPSAADAAKLYSPYTTTSLVATCGEEPMAMLARDLNSEVTLPLAFRGQGRVTLTAEAISGLSAGLTAVLEERATGRMTVLESGKTITLAGEQGALALHLRRGIAAEATARAIARQEAGRLTTTLLAANEAGSQVTIVDAAGRTVATHAIEAGQSTGSVVAPAAAGVYTIRVSGSVNTITRLVIQ